MNSMTKLSSKGQIVLPKDVRDALGWPEGQKLSVRMSGGRAILEPTDPLKERISWEEFRRRVPKHDGPALSLEEIDAAIERRFAEKYRAKN
jgi:AbrB family looped-hinge helix DNA binding protein